MSKPWRWYSLTLVAALYACDDESGSHDDHKNDGQLLVMTEVCPNETARLYVGDERVYDGSAEGLVGMPVNAPRGKAELTLWIDGERALEQTVTIEKGKTTNLSVTRDVSCGELDGGAGDTDAAVEDGGETRDGGPLEACSDADDTQDQAQTLAAGDREDQLCAHYDRDFFKFHVGAEENAATLELVTADDSGIYGELALFDADGNMLDVQRESEDADATLKALLFEGDYYVRVADLSGTPLDGADAGPATRNYTLSLAFTEERATTEAAAGTFHGATNDPEVPGLEGTYVAVSVHDANDKPVSYAVQVRIQLPDAEPEVFTFTPSALADGLLRTIFFDGTKPVFRRGSLSTHTAPFAHWIQRPITHRTTRPGIVTKEAVTGAITVTFASMGDDGLTLPVDSSKLLGLPTVSAATASGNPTTLAVTSARPTGVAKVEAEAFSASNAARGTLTPAQANFNIVLDGKLDDDEPFVVRVRASDKNFLTLPLVTGSNLSEFVYYSDETASQE
jgi:hypothetical protein